MRKAFRETRCNKTFVATQINNDRDLGGWGGGGVHVCSHTSFDFTVNAHLFSIYNNLMLNVKTFFLLVNPRTMSGTSVTVAQLS